MFWISENISVSLSPPECLSKAGTKREEGEEAWMMEGSVPKMLELLVTHVRKEHGLVKIFGQTDVSTGTITSTYLPGRRTIA
jgi:hypothetical protein